MQDELLSYMCERFLTYFATTSAVQARVSRASNARYLATTGHQRGPEATTPSIESAVDRGDHFEDVLPGIGEKGEA